MTWLLKDKVEIIRVKQLSIWLVAFMSSRREISTPSSLLPSPSLLTCRDNGKVILPACHCASTLVWVSASRTVRKLISSVWVIFCYAQHNTQKTVILGDKNDRGHKVGQINSHSWLQEQFPKESKRNSLNARVSNRNEHISARYFIWY